MHTLAVTVHDDVVIGKQGNRAQILLLTGGVMLILAGTGLWLAATRLDVADQWGSVVSAIAALLGLPMTAYGVVLARRQANGANVEHGPAQVLGFVEGGRINGHVTGVVTDIAPPPGGIVGVARVRDVGAGGQVEGVHQRIQDSD
jgi:hypothetical protein